MNFTEEVKKELISIPDEPCCEIAGLSAYIKCSGTFEIKNGEMGFTLTSENPKVLGKYAEHLSTIYGEEPYNVSKVKRIKAEYYGHNARQVLVGVGIIENDGGVMLNFNIDKYITENDCCKRAYIKGVFLGAGSVSVPDEDKKIGYHLEFVFSNYAHADGFCELMSGLDLMPKLIERKGFVVYFNNAKEICQVLKVMGAKESEKKLKKIIRSRAVKNNINRQMNCEMSNISKQVNASIRQRNAIALIEQTIGIDALGEDLAMVCKGRINSPESSMEILAEQLGISKSCLNHRLRKIMEISKNLN